MTSGEKFPSSRDSYVDLDKSDYYAITNKIIEAADAARIEGKIGSSTEKSAQYFLSGSVISGGYENMPTLLQKLGRGLTANHSFDLYYRKPATEAEALPSYDLQLRLYSGTGNDFVIERTSEEAYVPYWTSPETLSCDAESPMGDHTKLDEAEMKALLWSLTQTGDEKDFRLLDPNFGLEDVVLFAFPHGQESARLVAQVDTYASDGFDVEDTEANESIPGSRLVVTRRLEQETQKKSHATTEYVLTARHPEVATVDEHSEVWLWVTYEFRVVVDAEGVLQRAGATVDVDFKVPEEVLFVPQYWLEYQRQKQQTGMREEFYGVMLDTLADLFTDRT